MIECRFEPLSYMLLNGLVDLSYEAWCEMENEHAEVDYSPDWEAYQRNEDSNRLRFISLREGGNLIGYASIRIESDIHRAGITFASFLDIYIKKEKRGYAAQFVRFIEKQLSGIGVVRVYATERVRSRKSPARFYEAMGFELQEQVYGKTIGQVTNE